MQKILSIIAVLAVSASLSGCVTDGVGNKQLAGMGLGAAAGGFGGSMIGKKGSTMNTLATIGGTLLGGFLGGEIGSSLDKADKLNANQALTTVQPGQQLAWTNPNTGKQVTFTPGPQVAAPQGAQSSSLCRSYQAEIENADKTVQRGSGTACKQADGTWSY